MWLTQRREMEADQRELAGRTKPLSVKGMLNEVTHSQAGGENATETHLGHKREVWRSRG